MTRSFPWRTAFKIAWRESRASSAKFLFVVLAVAAGVGALAGVRGFSRSFEVMLLREARTLMAADLTARVFELPNEGQLAAITDLESRGVRQTQVTETVTMISSEAVPDPLLVSVKAVDPAVYPFYGSIRLDPPAGLAEALARDSIVVSDDLLMRLRVRVGDHVRLGGQDFRIAAVVVQEPDRMTGSLNVGPRLMMTREGLDLTGLIVPGSRASQRFLFRLPEGGPPVGEVRNMLRAAFPEGRVVDFRETHPLIERGLRRATRFLSLVSLIALIVGALGVATAMRSHLEQKLDSIAVMKSLGARSGQIIRIYLVQALLLAVAGGALGVLAGGAVQRVFPELIARYFSVSPAFRWDVVASVQGFAAGLLTALLFTLPPLLQVRRIRPTVIFRRDMEEPRPPWRRRLKESRASVLAAGALLVGIGLIAVWLSDSLLTGAVFVSGLAAGILVLSGVAWLVLRLLRLFLQRAPWRLPATVRHGMANLYRPGNHAAAVLVALGTGVMFTLAVFLVQRSVLAEIASSMPAGAPNVFLINITEAEREGVVELVSVQPGVESPPEIVASVAARLDEVDGVPVERFASEGPARRYLRARQVTWASEKPPDTVVVGGAWWTANPPGEPSLSVAEEAAELLGIKPGARLSWSAAGHRVHARVASIHRTEAVRPGSSIEFIFSPGTLDGIPVVYYGGVRAHPSSVAALQRAAYERYPTITVINVADVIKIVQEVVDQIALVTRFISSFAILAGVVILASSVAGTRFRRIRETAILKTLGATRGRVAVVFSVEFLVLGAVAGLMGGLLATGFSALAMNRLFEAGFRFDLAANFAAVVLTALVAAGAGWLASFRILGRKPVEVLREE